MTSILDLIDDNEETMDTPEVPEGKEQEFILDLSNPVAERIEILDNYFLRDENGAVEVLRQLNSMWYMCGIKAIENFFLALCYSPTISSILKLSVAKSLSDSENKLVVKNALLSILGTSGTELGTSGTELGTSGTELGTSGTELNLPTPCRVEALELLMNYSQDSLDIIISHLKNFLRDSKIEEEFKYKTILNLENLSSTWMREQLLELFPNKEFVKHIFLICKELIRQEFPIFVPKVDNEDFFELLLLRMNYDKLVETYKIWGRVTNNYDLFIQEAQLCFLYLPKNSIFYRILSAQYLLQKCSPDSREDIENILLAVAENPLNTENERADAADTLLQLGGEEMKTKGRDIIVSLGIGNREHNTLYTNTQNVHNTAVEDSISELLEFFSNQSTFLINRIPITFTQVRKSIEAIGTTENIQLSLNRIHIDRALYSKYNISLETLLVKLWSYIKNHEYEEEFQKRLLQELEDMAGTCSTGFASRIVNVVSGFGEFNIRISWEDQIIANFSGRLNAKARIIQDEQSIFRTKYYPEVKSIQTNTSLQNTTSYSYLHNPLPQPNSKSELSKDIDSIIESFSQCVLEELSIKSSEPHRRKNFNLFLKHSISDIRDEMYSEFCEFLDDTTFDLYFRKALLHYEGEF